MATYIYFSALVVPLITSHVRIIGLTYSLILWTSKMHGYSYIIMCRLHMSSVRALLSVCGVRGVLVVTLAAIRQQGPRFKLRPRQKFETRFLLHAHLCSASGTTMSGTRASPKPGNSPRKVSK